MAMAKLWVSGIAERQSGSGEFLPMSESSMMAVEGGEREHGDWLVHLRAGRNVEASQQLLAT